MEHVGLVEPIVAQLIVDNFIGREITNSLRHLILNLLGGKQQYRFGKGAAMKTILGITYRTDGDDHLGLRAMADDQVDAAAKVGGTLTKQRVMV